MLIPGSPVKKPQKRNRTDWQNSLIKPFPFLPGEQAILSCGREALYFGLRLLKDLPERAHVPAYCCRSVLVPFKKLGIEIKFYDVGKHLEPIVDKNSLKKKDLFLLIHYFGIPQDIQSIKQLCEKFGLILIEDCAHTLPDPEAKHPMSSSGAFSIYSLRKQLPVPDGGVLVVNDENLKKRIGIIPKPRLRNTSIKKWGIMLMDKFAFYLGWPNTLYIKDALRDKIGSTDSIFYSRLVNNDPIPEISYAAAKILSNVDFGEIARIRRKNYSWLVDRLKNISKVTVPFSVLPDGAVPQGLPVFVEDVDHICTSMRRKGLGVDRWPGSELPEEISCSNFPGTFSWVKSLVLLPLHQDLREVHLGKMVQVLVKIINISVKS